MSAVTDLSFLMTVNLICELMYYVTLVLLFHRRSNARKRSPRVISSLSHFTISNILITLYKYWLLCINALSLFLLF